METSDFDPASGCEDDDLSDALPADSADDSDSDVRSCQVALNAIYTCLLTAFKTYVFTVFKTPHEASSSGMPAW